VEVTAAGAALLDTTCNFSGETDTDQTKVCEVMSEEKDKGVATRTRISQMRGKLMELLQLLAKRLLLRSG
jgi:hypothetical protein